MRGKKITAFLLCLCMVLAMFTTVFAEDAVANTQDAIKITIMHTNDTHSRVSEGDGMGLAKVSSFIKELKQQNPNALVLDAGDTFHGQTIATLSKGESIANIMNTIGYDAMAPGNHDFNYGYERLAELDKITNFPILAANIKKADGSDLFTPYIIKEIAGVKIGIFGLATPETTYKTHPDNVKGLAFKDPVEAAAEMVALLKDQTDVIIALAHLGMDEASVDTSTRVAAEVEGIDLIVDGHSHTVLEQGKLIGSTMIVSTGEFDKNFGIVDLLVTNGKVSDIQADLISKEEASVTVPDEAVKKAVDAITAEQAFILNQVVGKTSVDLEGAREKVRTGETNLGNLITDAMIAETGADCALTNGGGIRASIPGGDITKGQVITVLPFGNYIVTKKVPGSDIKAALELGTGSYPAALGGFPHVSGIRYTIDTTMTAGDRVVDITVKGQPLDLQKEYILATNDFMAVGGDNYTMFADNEILNEYCSLDEAVIEYILAKGTVSPALEARISVKEAAVAEVKEEYYIVKKGDWLSKIAIKFNTTWQKLQELNKIKNPDLIFPNQKILLP